VKKNGWINCYTKKKTPAVNFEPRRCHKRKK
jgi:hypothetical protein